MSEEHGLPITHAGGIVLTRVLPSVPDDGGRSGHLVGSGRRGHCPILKGGLRHSLLAWSPGAEVAHDLRIVQPWCVKVGGALVVGACGDADHGQAGAFGGLYADC